MRFILEYVTCCMISTPLNKEEPPSPRTEDETRSLVTEAPSSRVSRHQRRTRTPRGSPPDWRPSLFAISEDNVVAVEKKKKAENVRRTATMTTARQRDSQRSNANRCSRPSAGRVNAPSRPYEYSHEPLQMVIPAFSAAPFMF